MKTLIKSTAGITLLIACLSISATAQTTYRCEATSSSVVIEGTSSLHDWEMTATEFSSQAKAELKAGTSITLTSGSSVFKAKKIVSGTSGMDKKAYEALKADANPEITFTLSAPVTLPLTGKKAAGTLNGTLKLAGVSKPISFPVTIDLNATMVVSATIKLKMSDFQMIPPTAIMGTIKTGDEVVVKLKLTYLPL